MPTSTITLKQPRRASTGNGTARLRLTLRKPRRAMPEGKGLAILSQHLPKAVPDVFLLEDDRASLQARIAEMEAVEVAREQAIKVKAQRMQALEDVTLHERDTTRSYNNNRPSAVLHELDPIKAVPMRLPLLESLHRWLMS